MMLDFALGAIVCAVIWIAARGLYRCPIDWAAQDDEPDSFEARYRRWSE